MSEKTISVILKKKEGSRAGESIFKEYPANVFRRGEERAKSSGSIVYIFPPQGPSPEPGDLVYDGEKNHAVASIRICRGLDGMIRGIKCTALS